MAVPLDLSDMDTVKAASNGLTKMLTANDLAEMFQVGAKTVRRWRDEQVLPPAFEVGGVVRWSSESIRRWIEEGVA